MRERGNGIKGRTNAACVCSLDHHDEFSLQIAAVDLGARKRLNGARDRIEPLRPRLHENAGDFNFGRWLCAVWVYPFAVHEFSTIDTVRHWRFGYSGFTSMVDRVDR